MNNDPFEDGLIGRIRREQKQRERLLGIGQPLNDPTSSLARVAAGVDADRLSALSKAATGASDGIVASNGADELIRRAVATETMLERMGGATSLARRAEQAMKAKLEFERAWKPFAADYSRSMNAISEQMAKVQEGVFDPINSVRAYHPAEMGRLAEAIDRINRPWKEQISALSAAIDSINKPLLRTGFETQSLTAIGRLSEIGKALSTSLPYDQALGDRLRTAFGDWRGIELPKADVLDDLTSRSRFYRERGYDGSLVDFPEEGFEEVLDIVAIGPVGESAEDESLAIEIYQALRRIERELRALIVEVLHSLEGDNWLRRALPQGMAENWLRKQEAARKNGEPEQDPIHYADFTDYLPIVQKRNLWREGFSTVFVRKTDIEESLQRLAAIRIPDMHARPMTQDDLLLVRVEGNRILRAIRRSTN